MSHSISNKGLKLVSSTVGIMVILIIWHFAAASFNPLILPSPGETWQALKEISRSGQLIVNLLITLRRTLLGYSAAIFSGLLLAVFLNASRFWRYLFRPIITIIQVIPPVIWLVLAVIWFGIADDITPIFLIFIVTLPVIFLNIYTGLEGIDLKLIEMATVYQVSKQQIILNIYIPSLVNQLVSAVSIGLAIAWKAAIFAEFLGSSAGIGFALSMANSNLETEELFGWTLVLIGLMLIFEYLLIRPLQQYATRWRQND